MPRATRHGEEEGGSNDRVLTPHIVQSYTRSHSSPLPPPRPFTRTPTQTIPPLSPSPPSYFSHPPSIIALFHLFFSLFSHYHHTRYTLALLTS